MPELEAGFALDKAVAERCGFPHGVFSFDTHPPTHSVTLDDGRPFSPSADLNAAFFAAEKVELFANPELNLCYMPNTKLWHVEQGDPRPPTRWHIIGCGTSPALAICAAILKLNEPVCEHDFVDARNEVVTSGKVCTKCGAIRS